ncbi:MAG: imidazoleglycerol-phosphate dehydratase HisB [Candidatus Margulisiibacteriota bacterium]|jgi:imidazoleglycerol-phosphate dehydratase
MRKAKIDRMTKETKIKIELNLDGTGVSQISTGVPFFNHLMDLFTRHSGFNLKIVAKGDTQVDDHHTIEDIGICLGLAFKQALGKKAGIRRYASIDLPMDEALVRAALDISGRPFLVYNLKLDRKQVKDFEVELIKEFFRAFVNKAEVTLHFYQEAGETTHHILEAVFKGWARVMADACRIDPKMAGKIPSTKGVI